MKIIKEAEDLKSICEFSINNNYFDIETEFENIDENDDEYYEPLSLPPGASKPPKNWPHRRRR